MTAPEAQLVQERERLRAALDGYAADDLSALLGSHNLGVAVARRKAERIDRLVQALTDPEYARRALSTLSPLGRRLLAVAHRHGRAPLAALFLAGPENAGDARQDAAVRQEVEELLRRGLLVLDKRDAAGPRDGGASAPALTLADPAAGMRWVWSPLVARETLALAADADAGLAPLESAPPRVETGSFALLQRDLYLALRFLKGQGLRLTRTGEPHRTDLRKLLAALQPGQPPPARGSLRSTAGRAAGKDGQALDGRLLFLLRLLDATGLAVERDGLLRVDEGAETFLNESEPVAASWLYEAWLDLDWDEFRRVPGLVFDPWSYGGEGDVPGTQRLAAARRAIGVALAAAPEGWVGLDALADLLRRTDPEFLIPRLSEPPAAYHSYYGYSGGYYQNWLLQEQAFYRGFVRAEARGRDRRLRKDQDWHDVEGAFVAQVVGESLRWLGLVDVGFDSVGSRESAVGGGTVLGDPRPPPTADSRLPTAVRLTELGARIFGGRASARAESPASAASAAIVVQPSFEVLVLDALAHLDLLAQLDAFADARSLDRAAIYHLTRPALVRGLEAGWTAERVVALLERESAAPLPQNVRHTLHDWAREFERIHLRGGATLLEAPDAGQLARWLADATIAPLVERCLTPMAALLRAPDAARAAREPSATLAAALARDGVAVRAINYALDAPRVLDVPAPGRVVVAPDQDDPYLHYRLARFADRQDGAEGGDAARSPAPDVPAAALRAGARYAITPRTLARAKEGGMTVDEILSFLAYKARGGLSPDDYVTLRGWAGAYAPARFAPVRAVELPAGANWGDFARVKAIGPLVLRVLSTNLALVSEEHWPRLERELAARGIALAAGLTARPVERNEGGDRAERRSAAQRAADSLGLATARDLLDRPPPRARADGGVPLRRLAGRPLCDFIEEALDNETPLVIEYQKPSERRSTPAAEREATIRVVEPRGLEVRGGSYYLHAFCRLRQEERDFRLSNILGVALAEG